MKNDKNNIRSLVGIVIVQLAMLGGSSSAQAQTTGFNKTAGGPFVYTDAGNWVGGIINGVWDPSLALSATQTVTFGSNTVLGTGLSFNYTNNSSLNLRGSANSTLTLGGDIVHGAGTTATVNIGSSTGGQNLNVDLGGQTRTFTVASGRTLQFLNVISNGGVAINGGTVNFSGTNTYSGNTTINSGTLSLNGASSSANSNFIIRATTTSSTLAFNNSSGSGATRAQSVTLNGLNSLGAILSITGNATNNSVDAITGNLTLEQGFGIVSINPNVGRNARLTADSFVRNARTAMLFRGTNLGASPIADQVAGSANIVFANAPTLVGGGGAANTSTISILPGSYGGNTVSNNNGNGLVTYDSTYGVRLLNTSTEYTSSITDGQTQLDNVRLVGSTGANLTNTINSATTINSLSLIVPATTSGGAGVTVAGTGTLTLGSGTIFASQTITAGTSIPAVSDAMVINSPILNFNGREAMIIVAQTNAQNSASNITNAPLQINSVITNADGLTKAGAGYLRLGGTSANTYSGVTTMNAGTLGLGKTAGVNALGGDLVVNGGNVYWVTSNQLGDSANITVNGGGINFRPSNNTGSSSNETFNNLTMTGGTYNGGSVGSGNAINMNNVTLTGGTFTQNRNNDVNIAGLMDISNGAEVTVARSESGSSIHDTLLTIGDGAGSGDGISITNTASGAYTPITLVSGTSATNFGGRIVLNGDLTFTGNGTNSNTTTIDSPTDVGPRGTIGLSGVRTFDVGNGAAAVDLTIVAGLTNGVSAGGLNKTGTGTLALNGTNSYFDETTVGAGTLLVNGTLSNTLSVTVASGARLGGSGTINATVGGAGSINPGNSPGIQTFTQVDPSGGLDFNFEFTLANSAPVWSNATASGNDVLRLSSGSTPFASALDSSNVLSLYLGVSSLSAGDVFTGGFFTDLSADFLSSLANATGVFYVLGDGNGTFNYNGVNYYTLAQYDNTLEFDLSTVLVSAADFAGGTVNNGYVMEWTAMPIPEPSTYAMLALGLGALWLLRRKGRSA